MHISHMKKKNRQVNIYNMSRTNFEHRLSDIGQGQMKTAE